MTDPIDHEGIVFQGSLPSKWGDIFFESLQVTVGHTSFNGYIKIPDGHPWKKHCNEEVFLGYDVLQELASKNPMINKLVGGSNELTFLSNEGWIGFDTFHARDKSINWTQGSTLDAAEIWAQIVAEVEGDTLEHTTAKMKELTGE